MLTTLHASGPSHMPGLDPSAVLVCIRDPSTLNPALDWAVRRAQSTDGRLTLVHAVPGAELIPPTLRYSDVVGSGRALLQDAAARLSRRSPTLRVSTYLHCGDVIHALLGLSADASLLVVGADRFNRVTGVFQGSTAVQVASGSLAPVLIIPPGHREGRDRNGTGQGHVVVGVDGSVASRVALTTAAAEAHRLGAALRVVAAVRSTSPVPQDLAVNTSASLTAIRTAYPALTVSWIVDTLRTPDRALIRHSRDAALLVIGRHGSGTGSGMVLGSLTRTLLLRPPCPTLVTVTPTTSLCHDVSGEAVVRAGGSSGRHDENRAPAPVP